MWTSSPSYGSSSCTQCAKRLGVPTLGSAGEPPKGVLKKPSVWIVHKVLRREGAMLCFMPPESWA